MKSLTQSPGLLSLRLKAFLGIVQFTNDEGFQLRIINSSSPELSAEKDSEAVPECFKKGCLRVGGRDS